MSRKVFAKAGLAVVAGILVSSALAQPGAQVQNTPRVNEHPLFPVPACKVHNKRDQLADIVRNEYRPTGDGHIPWLALTGTWVDEARAIVVHFATEPFSNNRFGRAHVVVKSLCTGELLAKGSRLVTEEDLEVSGFEIRLRVYGGMRYSQLALRLDLEADLTGCAAQASFKRWDVPETKVVDQFWLYRP